MTKSDGLLAFADEVELKSEDDLWFLPGAVERSRTICSPGHGPNGGKPLFLMIDGKQKPATPRFSPAWLAEAAR
jgi:hypothetical protein